MRTLREGAARSDGARIFGGRDAWNYLCKLEDRADRAIRQNPLRERRRSP